MKRIYRTALLAVGVLALAGTALAQFQSFNVTNCLGSADAVIGWPTNTFGTNGLPQGTGNAISMANNYWATFGFGALVVANTNAAGSTMAFGLIRSLSGNPPRVTYATNVWSSNGYVLTASDWDTPTNGVAPITVTFVIPNLTNAYFHYTVDMPLYLMGAQWVGVYSMTNDAGDGTAFLTNVTAGLAKKIIPVRWP